MRRSGQRCDAQELTVLLVANNEVGPNLHARLRRLERDLCRRSSKLWIAGSHEIGELVVHSTPFTPLDASPSLFYA
jgi:hypothetical protein